MKKNYKKLFVDMLMFIVMIGGLCALLYPVVGDTLNNFWNQQVINYYQEKSNAENRQAIQQEQQRIKAENKKIAKMDVPGSDPFTKKEAKATKLEKDYYQQHTIAVIRIPKISVALPVFDQTDGLFLKRGAALLEGTSYPNGGKSTHTVITSHRGLKEARLFSDLPKLKKGHHFYLEYKNQTLAYKVDQIQTIEPTEVEALNIVEDKDYVTLMTCTPYGVNSHRLLVRGTRIPFDDEMKETLAEADRIQRNKYLAITIFCLLLIVGVGSVIHKRVKAAKSR
ncbi:sortase A [Enterococcus sp. AZ135]|uniref:class C sortase n=1 Tax=unclassified Enterococcus TaxID=2608891 RepID=UPI003F205E2E